MDQLLARLSAPGARARELALDELGDALERGALPDADARRALVAIQALLARESDRAVLESALHAAAAGAARGLARLVGWEALASGIARWERDSELLEYVLAILGGAGAPAHRPVLERFLEHADAQVRVTAQSALDELDV